MKKYLSLIIACVLLLCTSGCQMLTLFRFQELETFDEKKYSAFIAKIPNTAPYSSIVGATAQFNDLMDSISDQTTRHLLYQPIQILYFDNDSLVSFHNNCNAPMKGFNLNWNYENRFSCFPPHSAVSCDTIPITLQTYQSIYPEITNDTRYTVIIFWSNMLPKVSRAAIKTTFKNINNFDQKDSTSVFLINNDKFYIELNKEESQKD